MKPEEVVAVVTGTTAFTSFLIYVVKTLWAEHLRHVADALADARAQRDLAREERNVAIAGWREQTVATNNLATVVEKQTRADAAARRKR